MEDLSKVGSKALNLKLVNKVWKIANNWPR